MRISDWSSDVCSSDLLAALVQEFTLPVLFGALPKKNLLPVLMLYPTELPETNSLIADTLGRVRAADPARECDLVLALLRHCFEIGRASCRERVCQYV